MAWRILTAGLVLVLLVAGVLMLLGPWLKTESVPGKLPSSPYLQQGDLASVSPEVVAAIGAYEAIRETLSRGSIEGVPQQAEVIARAFAAVDPKIASVAKRLAAEQDVESAKRAFMRLNRLMEKHAQKRPLPQA
jgi:hypothetical protein